VEFQAVVAMSMRRKVVTALGPEVTSRLAVVPDHHHKGKLSPFRRQEAFHSAIVNSELNIWISEVVRINLCNI